LATGFDSPLLAWGAGFFLPRSCWRKNLTKNPYGIQRLGRRLSKPWSSPAPIADKAFPSLFH